MGASYALVLGMLAADLSQAPSRGSERVIHRFDFNERLEGNMEEYPKYWERVAHPNSPLFASAGFDFALGRKAPPSFHLASRGRDVAFAYLGPETMVEPGKRFRIEGFIRPDRLVHARACLSAAYRRGDGTTLLDTLVRSPYIAGEDGHWREVELYLPPAPVDAEAIVLTAWVLQESSWNTGEKSGREIDRVDVDGGAWLDDIVVVGLPRIDLRVANGLNVLGQEGKSELLAIVDDVKLHELDLLLNLLDAAGKVWGASRLQKDDFNRGIARLSLSSLPPGVYRATLRVVFEGQLIDSRTAQFAVLADLPEAKVWGTPAWGIVLNADERLEPSHILKLLGLEHARATKVPIVAGSDTADAGQYASDLLFELMKRSFDITAVLVPAGGPSSQARGGIEVFSREAALWESEVASAAARYAGTTRWWQVGRDGAELGAAAGGFETAINNVREVLDRYALGPKIAATWSVQEELASEPNVEGVTLRVDSVAAEQLAQAISQQRAAGLDRVSVFAEPLDKSEYGRVPRLTEWVRRIIAARHAGADTVYVPQPWSVQETYEGPVSEPAEEFVLFRTIAGLIGDGEPGPHIKLGDARVLVFYREETAVLALWDDVAPPGGRKVALQLGRAEEVVDPWGNREALERDSEGRHLIHLSRMPVFVPGVESWLVELLTSVRLEPGRVAPGADTARHTLKIDYHGARPVAAALRLSLPKEWRASPAGFDISLSPREALEIPFELRRPHNEPAGVRQIVAEVRVENPDYLVEVPIPLEIALDDVEVGGWALLVGNDLVLRHAVRNTGGQALHLRSSAAVPGRQRQYRPIVNLGPGEAETVEYRFREGVDLSEREVYLTLRELNDGPRSHTLQVTVP